MEKQKPVQVSKEFINGRGKKTGSKLQPNFVEWMMGYPQNWTDLNYQERHTGEKE